MLSSWCMGLLDSIRSALGLRPRVRELDEFDIELAGDSGDGAPFDSGSFDFDRDIARYFTAEFRIETATHDPARRSSLFAEYEVEDLEHWQRIQAEFQRWLKTPAAKAKYRTIDDLMQARMSTTQTMTLADLGIAAVNLTPISGVTLEQWAKIEAAVESGAPLEPLIEAVHTRDAPMGLDAQAWAKIAAAWHARMRDDTSGRIETEYMLHFRVRPI